MEKQRSDISLIQTDQARSINSLLHGFTNIIDQCKGSERQIKSCNSVVISYRISSPTSICMVTFPFLIVRSTFSLHVLSIFSIFVLHKQGVFKFLALSGQYGKYPTAYEPIKL